MIEKPHYITIESKFSGDEPSPIFRVEIFDNQKIFYRKEAKQIPKKKAVFRIFPRNTARRGFNVDQYVYQHFPPANKLTLLLHSNYGNKKLICFDQLKIIFRNQMDFKKKVHKISNWCQALKGPNVL